MAVSVSQRADMDFVNELRVWSKKYLDMTTILGLNLGWFTYQILKTSLHWYVAMPLGFTVYFLGRNVLTRNCMDRIYYSSEHVYKKFR